MGMHVVGAANLDFMEQNFGSAVARWYFEYHWDDPGRVDAAMGGALAEDADVTILHFIEVDQAGHSGDPKAYARAVAAISARLEILLRRVNLATDAVIVTSDHGHARPAGGHGGPEPDVARVPLLMVGRGIRRGVALEKARSLAVVGPTISALLGIHWPQDMESPPLWEALDPSVLGEDYLAARRSDWIDYRAAYERRWLAGVFADWTSTSWSGELVGNDVSEAATVADDASLDALMVARARSLAEIDRDRRVGRTPTIALVLVPIMVLFLVGVLRGYRSVPILAVPLFGVGVLGTLALLGVPPSFTAVVTHGGFALQLALSGMAGLAVYTPVVLLLTRDLPDGYRWRAFRFHFTAAALVYASIAPLVWGVLGYGVKAPLPSALWLFSPLVAGILGSGFLTAAGLVWLAAIFLPYARPADPIV
jgi:hypothetical protein